MQVCANFRCIIVHQVLRTMNSDFSEVENGCIAVDDDQLAIFLPDDDTSLVVIAFNQDADPGYAADFCMRFCKLPDLAGLNVVVAPSFVAADSTGSTAVATVH